MLNISGDPYFAKASSRASTVKSAVRVFDSFFRWHDLRHTWASWHVQNGTPLHALQELGGWNCVEIVRRYAHFSAEHLAPYADRLSALRDSENSCHGTNSSQPAKEQAAA